MIDRFVKQQARETITQNALKDKANVRYARVPSATESYANGCPFCQMLASRGFVYYNEKTAGGKTRMKAFGAYHDFCNCQPVPAFFTVKADGYGRRDALDVSIPGYDPDALYQYYLEHLQRFASMRSQSSLDGKSGWNGGARKRTREDTDAVHDYIMEYVRGAKTYEELRERCAEMDRRYKNRGWNTKDNEFLRLQSEIAILKKELRAA